MKRKSKPFSPVIIIGMHSSGTSMIARMLSRLGMFMGDDLEANHESEFFLSCNEWLLRQSGGTWGAPVAMKWIYSNAEFVTACEEYLQYKLSHFPVHNYVGWQRFLAGDHPLPGLQEPWGWKDPRNTFTLPFWMRLFPDAKVIHIYRNGVAVAASLRAKIGTQFARSKYRHGRRLKLGLYRWAAKRSPFAASMRCLDLAGGLSLWEEYVNEAFASLDHVKCQVFTIKYENFINDPSSVLSDLAPFCGLHIQEAELAAIAADADRSHGDRFMSDPESAEFYQCVKDSYWMRRLGYDDNRFPIEL